MQNWYKNVFVDATVPFQLPYMQIWTALSNRDYITQDSYRRSTPPKYVSVLREGDQLMTEFSFLGELTL